MVFLGFPCRSPPPPAVSSSSYPCRSSFVVAASPGAVVVGGSCRPACLRCLSRPRRLLGCCFLVVGRCPPSLLPPSLLPPSLVPPGTTPRAVARGRGSGCCWSWSSWSGSWACGLATTQPPHEQGLVAVVGVGQGAPVVSRLFLLVERKKEIRKKTYVWPRRRR